jgi:hypothetical protein
MNKINERISDLKDLKLYDIVLFKNVGLICVVADIKDIAIEIICNIEGVISDAGVDSNYLSTKYKDYKCINKGRWYGYTNLHKECVLLKRSNGKRPTLNSVIRFTKTLVDGEYARVKSVKGLKIGDTFIFNNVAFKVKKFPTKTSVCGINENPTSGEPSSCKVPISKIKRVSKLNKTKDE